MLLKRFTLFTPTIKLLSLGSTQTNYCDFAPLRDLELLRLALPEPDPSPPTDCLAAAAGWGGAKFCSSMSTPCALPAREVLKKSLMRPQAKLAPTPVAG